MLIVNHIPTIVSFLEVGIRNSLVLLGLKLVAGPLLMVIS